MRPRTGAHLFWECLVREGVTHVFGYPGGAVLPIYDAMLEYPVHHVLVRHEQAAAHMAEGYARTSGRVGVALATSGPGATNLVTGIANAMMDSSPIVCVTGQVNAAMVGYDAFQETDITGITLPITKHNYLVRDVRDLPSVLREAFHLARTGRPGPVLVAICKDVQEALVQGQPEVRPPRSRALPCAGAEEIARAAELIGRAQRPVILAGHGVLLAGATDELRALAETACAPVASTLLGLGVLPASHRLSLGMMGMHGLAWTNFAIQNADLLVAVGMRFDDRVTGNLHGYAPDARKIHFELDPSEINKNVSVDVALVGDLRESLAQLLPLLGRAERTEWMDRIEALRAEAAPREVLSHPEDGRLRTAHVIRALSRHTGGQALVVSDVGQHQMVTAQYYDFERPGGFVTSGGLGTMGFALPAALGAKVARPEADVWAVVGDGGFQMAQAELATATQEGIKITIAVINNGYLGMVRQWQEFFYDRRYSATPLRSPDFVKIAQAHGLKGLRVSRAEEVTGALAEAQASSETVLIDFRVEQGDAVYPMVPARADLHDMIRRPERATEGR